MCVFVQACFISGKVCRIVSSDPTTDTLRVLPDEDYSAFELIENLWNGESINITTDNVNILYKLGCELENEELVNLVFTSEELSVGTCISRLESRSGLDLSRGIEFISSHFSEFKALDLLKLRVDELESILTHESFKIESENALLENLNHPNTTRLESVFVKNDALYIVEKFVEQSLRDIIDRRRLNPQWRKSYAYQLLSAIRYLHDRHIVHCGISTPNILIENDGHVILTDFIGAFHEGSVDYFICPLPYRPPEAIEFENVTSDETIQPPAFQ